MRVCVCARALTNSQNSRAYWRGSFMLTLCELCVSYAFQRPVHSFLLDDAEIMVFVGMNDFLFIAIYFRKHE